MAVDSAHNWAVFNVRWAEYVAVWFKPGKVYVFMLIWYSRFETHHALSQSSFVKTISQLKGESYLRVEYGCIEHRVISEKSY